MNDNYAIIEKSDGSQFDIEGFVEISSDIKDMKILFKGNRQEFERMGFNQKQIGGFEIIDGETVFNQSKYDSFVAKQEFEAKPLAMGTKIKEVLIDAMTKYTDVRKSPASFIKYEQTFHEILRPLESPLLNPVGQQMALYLLTEAEKKMRETGINGGVSKVINEVKSYLSQCRFVE